MDESSGNKGRREFLKFGVMFGIMAVARPLSAYSPPAVLSILPPNAIFGSRACLDFSMPRHFVADSKATAPQAVPFRLTAKATHGNASFQVAKSPDAPEWTIIGPAPMVVPSDKEVAHVFHVLAAPGAPKINLTISVKLDTKMGCWGTDAMELSAT